MEFRILIIEQGNRCPLEEGAWQSVTEACFPSSFDLFGGRWRLKSEPSLPQRLFPDQGPPNVQTGFPGISPQLTGYKQMEKWTESCELRKQSSNMGEISDLSEMKCCST